MTKKAEKLIEICKAQQELAHMLKTILVDDPCKLLASLMLCNSHNSNKILFKVLDKYNVPRKYYSEYTNKNCKEEYMRFSSAVRREAHYLSTQLYAIKHNKTAEAKNYKVYSKDEIKLMPHGAKAQQLRELACIIADMADAFDILEISASERGGK